MTPDDLLGPIRDRLGQMGFELVDFRRVGTLQRPILQIRVDRPGSVPGQGVTAGDCATVSRFLERWLEETAVVGPRYVLEVSSPGVERPVRFADHWRRYVGSTVRLSVQGMKGHPQATILAVPDDAHVTVRLVDGNEVTLALDRVRDATLVVEWPTHGKR